MYYILRTHGTKDKNGGKTLSSKPLIDLGITDCYNVGVLFRCITKVLSTYIGKWRSLVSVPALGAGGRGFESHLPDHLFIPVHWNTY